MTRTIDDMLAEARTRLARLSPAQADEAVRAGAVLVDIRPAAQRAAEGEIPGAVIVERNVLEWRFDPASAARLPIAGYDLQIIVFCSEGYTSSLAAAALQELGVHRATDLAGGFKAWQASGRPVTGPAAAGPAAAGPAAAGPAAAGPAAAGPAVAAAGRQSSAS